MRLAERIYEKRGKNSFMRTIALEKTVNPVGKGTCTTAFSELAYLCVCVRTGCLNKEPVEISWELDPG